jgi:N-methylhydantoinase A
MGGTAATVTDALVVLGYLDPRGLLGGRLKVDVDASLRACASLGEQAGLDPIEVAWGVREVALTVMGKAVRNRIATRGLAAADLDLIVFGGCGGLFAADIASAVGANRALIPGTASVFSAFGVATTSLRRESALSVASALPMDESAFAEIVSNVWADARQALVASGVPEGECSVHVECDMRFERQGSELTIPLSGTTPAELHAGGLAEAFRQEYAGRFGQGALVKGVGVDLVTIRAIASGHHAGVPTTGLREHVDAESVHHPRLVHIDRDAEPLTITVIDPDALPLDHLVQGPVLLDDVDTTIWVPSHHTVRREEHGALVVERQA